MQTVKVVTQSQAIMVTGLMANINQGCNYQEVKALEGFRFQRDNDISQLSPGIACKPMFNSTVEWAFLSVKYCQKEKWFNFLNPDLWNVKYSRPSIVRLPVVRQKWCI